MEDRDQVLPVGIYTVFKPCNRWLSYIRIAIEVQNRKERLLLRNLTFGLY